jgi:hypothetical protein
MKKQLWVIVAVGLMALPHVGAQQRARKGTPAGTSKAAGRVEPLRTIGGNMMGNRITARSFDDRLVFDYTLRSASIVDGKLQFQGELSAGGSSPVAKEVATLTGTVARAANPWPSAASQPSRQARSAAQQPQGREARSPEAASEVGQLAQATQPTARTTPTPTAPQGQRPAGEPNEQTQSLYAGAAVGTGCEIMFLKMKLPAPYATRAPEPVQLGVVLAPQDNQQGRQINQQICRIVRALDAKQSAASIEEQVTQLNRLLAAPEHTGRQQ